MEKLLDSLRAPCLSIFTVSRQMDNPQSPRWGRQGPLCQAVPCPTFPRAGGAIRAPTAASFIWIPAPCHPWKCVGFWERQSHPREPGSQQGLHKAGVSSGLSWPWARELWLPREAEVPLTSSSMRSQLSGSPPGCLSLHQSWPPVLKKAMIQDGEAGLTGCVLHNRATDSGVSETNLTLVFQLVQTIKIKAGLRWLRSSDGCCIFLIWQG